MTSHPLAYALAQVERRWRSKIVGSSGYVVRLVSRVGSFTLSLTLLSVVPISLNLPMKSWWGDQVVMVVLLLPLSTQNLSKFNMLEISFIVA